MADIVGAMTERLLVEAGVGPGRRVLDVGCGRGDVSFLVARLVGERGQVVGLDRDAQPLVVAREQANALGLSNVTFVEGDLGAPAAEPGGFDAVVGRRVLMYQPDPVAALRGLARALRPGGVIVFQEHDSTKMPSSLTPLPLHERVHGWLWRMVEREGGNVHMGLELARVLEQAGLAVEGVRAEAIVQTPTLAYGVGTIVRAVLPRIVQQGVATADEVDVDTLDQRLAEERLRAKATCVWELVFGAWARKPA